MSGEITSQVSISVNQYESRYRPVLRMLVVSFSCAGVEPPYRYNPECHRLIRHHHSKHESYEAKLKSPTWSLVRLFGPYSLPSVLGVTALGCIIFPAAPPCTGLQFEPLTTPRVHGSPRVSQFKPRESVGRLTLLV